MTITFNINGRDTIIDLKTLVEHAAKLLEKNLIIEADYKPISPLLIGDFTGESYKLVKEPTSGKIIGAYLTGIPTAQQIIGKARWLMRVAIATTGIASTHKEAEQTPIVATIKNSREKQVSLGPVELAFGNAKKKWKGLLQIDINITKRLFIESSLARGDDIVNAIISARNHFIDKIFFGERETTGKFDNRKKYGIVKYKWLWRQNRYKTLLARKTDRLNHNIIVVSKENENKRIYLYLKEPVSSSKIGSPEFKMKVFIDEKRLKKILSINKEKQGLVNTALILAILSIISSPLLLGLGTGTNRGFGRFKPVNIRLNDYGQYLFEKYTEYNLDELTDPINILEQLYKLANSLAAESKLELNKNGSFTGSMYNNLVPILPVKVNTEDLRVFRHELELETDMDVYVALGAIGAAAIKNNWITIYKRLKNQDKNRQYSKISDQLSDKGKMLARKIERKHFHTWPLGLPRSVVTKKSRTGYFILDSQNRLTQGRRQSFISAFYLNNKIYVIGYPSGDFVNKLLDKIVYVTNSKRFSTNKIEDILENVADIRNGRILNFSDLNQDPTSYKEFLKVTFGNYMCVLRGLLGVNE